MPLYTGQNYAGSPARRSDLAWVHEHIFAAGGAHIPAAWDEFSAQMGITAIVHLSHPDPLEFQGPAPGRLLWLDLEDEFEADVGMQALCGGFVHAAIEGGENVLLHSAHGRHRTRWVYVAYLIRAGKQVRAALRMAEQKPWQAPYHTDPEKWLRFQSYLRDQRSTG